MRLPTRLALILLGVLALAAPAEAQQQPREDAVRDALDRIEQQLEERRGGAVALDKEAAALEAELNRARAEMIVAARRAREQENAITRLEAELATLEGRAESKHADLTQRMRNFQDTMLALERLAQRPSWAMLVQPGANPHDSVRSGLLLRTALPQIEARAATLRQELDELTALRQEAATRRTALAEAGAELDRERDRLAALAEQKSKLLSGVRVARDDATQRIEQMVREADDLADLLGKLEEARREREAAEAKAAAEARAEAEARAAEAAKVAAEAKTTAEAEAAATREREERLAAIRPQEPPPQIRHKSVPISQARGNLTPPAAGQILVRYGEGDGFGGTAKGITYATRPGAPIVAPYDGRVVFAGQFKRFGLILIIEHGEGYHSLLAGLARIDVAVGQWVLGGEPVGSTGNGDDPEDLVVAENGRNGAEPRRSPTLYVELRREGQPINPLPWLADSKDKVRG